MAAGMATPKQQLSDVERRAWEQVRPSVVTLRQTGIVVGVAVCVDKRGYFLAHKTAVPSPRLFGRTTFGPEIELRQLAMDEPTQLVLLQALPAREGSFPAVGLGSEPEKAGGTLLAVLPTGPIRAEFVNGERLGVVKPSQRLMPLNELRFEALSSQIGGALVFRLDGKLLGVLGATLAASEPERQANQAKSADDLRRPIGAPGGLARPAIRPPAVQFGPAPQTVAYSVSSSVLQRVVNGFVSPGHKVVHPAIGVYCKDAAEPGAEVTRVQAGSPAERAGLRQGDLITAIGESPVTNQIDVARITMRLRVGATVDVTFKRDGETMRVTVSVGAS
jgi:S1-C subfamily serine protease